MVIDSISESQERLVYPDHDIIEVQTQTGNEFKHMCQKLLLKKFDWTLY